MSSSGLAGRIRVRIKNRGWKILSKDTPITRSAPDPAVGLASALRLPRSHLAPPLPTQGALKKPLKSCTSVTSSTKGKGEGCHLLEFVVFFIILNQGPQNS